MMADLQKNNNFSTLYRFLHAGMWRHRPSRPCNRWLISSGQITTFHLQTCRLS